jgi:deoxyribonuclease-4
MDYSHFDILTAPHHCWPPDFDAADRTALKSLADLLDIRIESLNLPSLDQNLASPTREAREYTLCLYRGLIDLASYLGSSFVVTLPGRRSHLGPPPTEKLRGWLHGSIEQLLPYAQRAGIRIVLENHPQSVIPMAGEMAEFVEQFGSQNLGICYDVANGEFTGEDHPAALRRIAPHLMQIHLSDSTRSAWQHDPIGTGSVDFRTVATTLREIGYTGTSIIEIISESPERDIAEGNRRLAEFGWECPGGKQSRPPKRSEPNPRLT